MLVHLPLRLGAARWIARSGVRGGGCTLVELLRGWYHKLETSLPASAVGDGTTPKRRADRKRTTIPLYHNRVSLHRQFRNRVVSNAVIREFH